MEGPVCFHDVIPYGSLESGTLTLTKGFSLTVPFFGISECMLVSANVRFEGEALPTIQFSLWVDGQEEPLYLSHAYTFGKADGFSMKEWRVPPMMQSDMSARLEVVIPEGTTVFLRGMSARYDAHFSEWKGGLRHNAHLGFYGIAPNNTMPSLELAAKCGFPACIVVPKVTKDGVLVCIHDDTINRTARDEDGNPPKENMLVWEYTYEELRQWDYGFWQNEIYQGTKIPKLEEFFDLCARTGMRPMFSTHPGLTVAQWQEVKEMLKKRGLLKMFHIKSFEAEVLATAYSVFGDEIDGYTRDSKNWSEQLIADMKEAGIAQGNCRVGIELPFKK